MLSNGKIIKEDNLPNQENAWLRLKRYVYSNNLDIKKMVFKGYGNLTKLYDNMDGYFYVKKMVVDNMVESHLSYGVGFLTNNTATIFWHEDDGTIHEEARAKEDCGFALIENYRS
jgi:hypothetical protein